MSIHGPYRFRKFAEEDNREFMAKIQQAGLTPTRMADNDGSVPISGVDDNGESVTIAWVRPIAPRKRGTRYDAPDEERDELAQRIVDALNAAEAGRSK